MLSVDLAQDRSERVRYNFPEYPAYIRSGNLSDYPHYTFPSHWHDDIELLYVTSGEMEYSVDGEILTLQAGNAIFINSKRLHYGFSSAETECTYFCILIHPSVLRITPFFEERYLAPVAENACMPYLVLKPEEDWQAEAIACLCAMNAEKDAPSAVLRIQSAFCKFWALLYEQMPHQSPPSAEAEKESRQLQPLKEMLAFLSAHYAEKLTLAEIAAAGNVCQSKCCALFRRYLSRTPMVYLTEYRLTRSAELLRSTDQSITDISFACGFLSASYYTETFRKWIGCTPKAYRAGSVRSASTQQAE